MSANIPAIRDAIRDHYLMDERQALTELVTDSRLSAPLRQEISADAAALVRAVRSRKRSTMMENFLAEYGLTTREGVALMCLAEALLRVPDAFTIDQLIEDKVAPGQWSEHLGQSRSGLVNSSTWALMLTGKLISPTGAEGLRSTLRGLVKRLGEPVIRVAVAQAMKELGRQFVLGSHIRNATERARKLESQGYTYSYDMLGEAARTADDAKAYFDAYSQAIAALAASCTGATMAENPGISVKLSALHPRYEFAKRERVMIELVARTRELARQAKQHNMGFNIDAEEADRLDLSLDVIVAVLEDPQLAGWDGFGVVVQAFGQRAPHVIDFLYAQAQRLNRRIMVRLVKGAYWDAEIKRAQTLGLAGFPVYTRKAHADVSYLCCAEKLLGMTDHIYPQFATHNAHSVAAVLRIAQHVGKHQFELQRLHGMGEALHDEVLKREGTRCRIYAPVGEHRDLLAYLVRRLLENGANSSFVNQIVDTRITPEVIARDPFDIAAVWHDPKPSSLIVAPSQLFGDQRQNAKGWDVTDVVEVEKILAARAAFATSQWQAIPMVAADTAAKESTESAACSSVINPAQPNDVVGQVTAASPADIESAIVAAVAAAPRWAAVPVAQRAALLNRVADQYEQHAVELFALAQREAGKTLLDAVGEVREAVDFARYYADQAQQLDDRLTARGEEVNARGVISCISPWNFPLAIFTGQVLAAIAAGNTVLAKPADQTPLIAARAVALMHDAGIPLDVVQLLPGSGRDVGAPLTADARIQGVCFTGSTATAQTINRAMASAMSAEAPLIAETGGLNAMIVDSTALPEQVVRDILASAFQSAGQRCSALRIVYLQEDIADHLLHMLYGAMDELALGDPWLLSTDIGPVIDDAARNKINQYLDEHAAAGRLLKRMTVPEQGRFVAPAVVNVNGIADMPEEIFGPVLHVARFRGEDAEQVVDAINARGFGLTFGLHTRMDSRVNALSRRIRVGNTYVNRNQIGAVVGSQPFGGEGLSGTGPKAGGPHYVERFIAPSSAREVLAIDHATITAATLQQALDDVAGQGFAAARQHAEPLSQQINDSFAALGIQVVLEDPSTLELPGPTGELNRLSLHPRGVMLCLGPTLARALHQAALALACGNRVVVIAPGAEQAVASLRGHEWPVVALDGALQAAALTPVKGIDAVVCAGQEEYMRACRIALAQREGALLPLIDDDKNSHRYQLERHICIDTTAAGGNASLIAAAE
ncbi:bifunctional proline dehydrogenase/L-glutamate gamma-semialdehyde dehydrogenase PutA [Oceanobacter sp. 4_MG-2023]|uniref:bifunctional proline dehydrogenase/L-glutamate gamma-semialdehyde dehydrogenase PutA n=1 Tax=Oceanobacter sp. 4_MG-2023 TaxID=3062623 RepID=UPI002733BF8E|nr:bifunctional proline dehydrogenase/L-glutamate gamma-semialdehyde dehydrogenase PutA [Oceanobacter sp. 4_MG-2023]MDP2547247.1 bifunctional proline dehydrogenase/L-glutamate gamma-semialdehyde dehydrogenase PutA [Oceanobacter sp. 4_MG-2023]